MSFNSISSERKNFPRQREENQEGRESPAKVRKKESSSTFSSMQVEPSLHDFPDELLLTILQCVSVHPEDKQTLLRWRHVSTRSKNLVDGEVLTKMWKKVEGKPVINKMLSRIQDQANNENERIFSDDKYPLEKFKNLSEKGFNLPQTMILPTEYDRQLQSDHTLGVIWDTITQGDESISTIYSAEEVRELLKSLHYQTIFSRIGHLDLTSRNIQAIPREISYFKGITVLDFSENELTTLPKELLKLKQLEELYLNDNQFSVLLLEEGELENLKVLDLSGNQLTAFPEGINKCENLVSISLDHNQLTSFYLDKIKGCQKLDALMLTYNQISKVSGQLKNSRPLTLGLNNNQLGTLSSRRLSKGQITLGGNPLDDSEELIRNFERNGWKHTGSYGFEKR
jgi:Leucine-rich repeat (LRR) protein